MLCHETQWTTKTTFIQSVCIIYSGLNVKITKKYAYSSPIISTFWKPESIIRNILQANYYRPQRSWGKVIFSQTSVILRGRGGAWPGGHVWRGDMQGGMHARGVCMVGGHAWQGGGMHGREGACMAGGHVWQGGMRGGCAWQGVCMAGVACMTCMPPGMILRLRHTVNERTVHILLECILVHINSTSN